MDGSAIILLDLSTPLANDSSRVHAFGTSCSRAPASFSGSLGVNGVREDGDEILPAGKVDVFNDVF